MKEWSELSFWNDGYAETKAAVTEGQHQPSERFWFRAMELCPYEQTRVCIVGQDPYPTPGLASGLAFSVPRSYSGTLPGSLRNIFHELISDIHCRFPSSGDLTPWARQGVLLWNTCLTVAPGRPGSHHDMGWEKLTQEVLEKLNEKEGMVFVLWGKKAQENLPTVLPSLEEKKNHVILSSHPSDLSARRGFFGSRPFSTINGFLKQPIEWSLP